MTRVEREAAARREAMDRCRELGLDFRNCMQAIIRNNQVRGFMIYDREKEEVVERIWV